TFLLETADGAPADPPSFTTVAPKWEPGDTIPLGRRTLRVVDVRRENPDEPRGLVVAPRGDVGSLGAGSPQPPAVRIVPPAPPFPLWRPRSLSSGDSGTSRGSSNSAITR